MARVTLNDGTVVYDDAAPDRGTAWTGVASQYLFDTTAHSAEEYFDAALSPELAAQLVAGTGPFTLVSATVTGPSQISMFDGMTVSGVSGQVSDLVFPKGVFLSSGHSSVPLYNSSTGYSLNTGLSGDSDVLGTVTAAFPGKATSTNDAAALQAVIFVTDPDTTSFTFDLVFGSEEFPEFSNSYVDGAVVMVDGVNYALFNGASTPLSVTDANIAAGYFYNNTGSTVSQGGVALPGAQMVLPVEYDGISQTLRITAQLGQGTATTIDGTSGTLHTIKIAIADTNDGALDSGIWVGNISLGDGDGLGVVINFDQSPAARDFFTNPAVLNSGSPDAEAFIAKYGRQTYGILIANAPGNQRITDAAGASSSIFGYGGNDTLNGVDGNDTLHGNAGNDFINGGSGDDTAAFSGPFARYSVTYDFDADRVIVTDSLRGGDGTDSVGLDVEHLSFADGVHDLVEFLPRLSVSGPTSVTEGNSGGKSVTYTVTRSGPTNGISTVDWSVQGVGSNSANAADFVGGVLPSGSLSFAASETSKTLTVNIAGDAVVEPNETFSLHLTNPEDAVVTVSSVTTTILNDDATLSIAAATASKAEGQSGSTPFTFTVTRTGDTSVAHSAHWAVSGAAVTGADFAGGALPSGTVSFAAGQTSNTITVNVAGDTTVEANEAFTVTLSSPSTGATLGTATASSTIVNDDATLSIAAATASKAEGNSGTTPFTFTVTRTGDTSVAHSAHWAVGGAAVTGADFAGGALPSGTVSFAAGQTSNTITVNVAGDTTVEANEAFTVTLSSPSTGVTLGTATASSTILNDDATLSIAAVAASKAEGNSGSTPFTFTVTRTGDTSVAHSAHWAVSGAAVTGADFAGGSLPSGTVSFAAGQTSSAITVNVAGDTTVEANEAFTVTLSSPSTGATLGTATASSTIVNDDATLSIVAVAASKAEGNSGTTPFTFTVTRTGDTSVAHSAHWAVGGAAVSGADFAGGSLPSGTVSFAVGQTSSTIIVNVAGDTTVEANEAFTVTLSSPSTGATLGTATASSTIVNDDSTAAVLSIAAVNASKAEGQSGNTPFTFTATRTGDSSGAASAHWAVSGAAVTGADFAGGALPTGTVSFAAGQTSSTITVNVAGDTTVEANEAFTVTLSSPSTGVTLGTATASSTILNDDATLSIAAVSASKAEGNSGNTPFTFTVTRTGDTSVAHSAHWAVSGAAVTGADFAGGSLPSGTVSFAAGQTSSTITVNVAGDPTVEANEAFTVTLSSPSTGATLGTATASSTILNDDSTAAAVLSIAAVNAGKAEGQSGSIPFAFTVTRAGDTSGAASAHWAVSGAAVNGADFTGGALPFGTVSFASGQTSSTITVNVAGDTTVEANEAFAVTLSSPSTGATLGTATATSTIVNDDATLSIAAVAASKAEGNGGTTPFTFTVTRTGDTSVAHSAHWAVGGAAVTGADFAGGALPSGTVSFAAGQTSSTITVNVAGDTTVEANEAFTVTLSSPSTGATLGTATASSTILNDDSTAAAVLSIAAVTASKVEGNSGSTPFTFTVTRTGSTAGASSANWTVSGSGVNGADFAGGALPSGTVSFATGQTSNTITVNVAGDTTVEANEAFTVTLSSPSTGATLGTAAASSTIVNDDATLSIVAATASKAEGQSGSTPFTFTVTRTGDTSVAHSAHWAVSGAAVTGADFAGGALPSGTVSFAAGQTSSTITVNVAGDTTVEANEAFTVTLSSPSTGATLGTATASSTILNDDATLSIAAVSASKAEGNGGSTPFTFTVTRTGDTSVVHSAHWAVSGAAVTGADFVGGSLPSGTVSFAAGQTSSTITVNVAGDQTVEANEAFTVTLSSPSTGATLGTATASSTILNDDATLSIAAVAASKVEGNSGTTPFTFTVTRTGDTSVAHSAHWAVGGAAVSGADFSGGALPSGTVSFAAGQTSSTITVNVAGDTTVEANEAFTVTLSSPSTGATLGTATASSTILNDDATLSIAAISASKAEGNSGTTPFTFTVTRTGSTAGTSSANWAVSGSGVNGADFVGGALPAGTVTFAAGETARTITVGVAGDSTIEANENFTVGLSSPSVGTTIATAIATGTILNDDAGFAIAAASADNVEGPAGTTTPFTFNITRTGDTTVARSVGWTVGGSSVTGADFAGGVLPAGTVDFAAGETIKMISVSVAGDSVAEGNEDFTVTLSNPGPGGSLVQASANGVIRNDDASSGSDSITGTPNTDYLNGLAGDDSLYGLAGDDVLLGGDGNDLLDGGPGNDLMVGDAGDDRYYVDGVGDVVLETFATDGNDTVFSSISYTLGMNVEQLVLTGTAAIDGTGNAEDNILSGNGAANVLSGGAGNDVIDGGGGVDQLIGGSGADTFVFSVPLVAGQYDTIVGFDANEDSVQLSSAVFHAFLPGSTVGNDAFELGSVATSSSTRLLYDSASGALLYDRDGLGGAAAVQFASVAGLSGTLSAANFKIE